MVRGCSSDEDGIDAGGAGVTEVLETLTPAQDQPNFTLPPVVGDTRDCIGSTCPADPTTYASYQTVDGALESCARFPA
jgi:hypothetical protein